MGNCFGKSESSSNFNGQGRTLGAAPAPVPAQPSSAKVPSSATAPKSPGRRLGSNAADTGATSDDPQSAAAKAAEERRKASLGKGKLGKQLDAQKSKTQAATLAEVSRNNVAARDADAVQESRAYN